MNSNAGPKLLLGHLAGTRCLLDHAAKVAAIALGLNAKLASPRQLPQLGDVGGDAPGLAPTRVEPEPPCVYNPNYHVVRVPFLAGGIG